MSRLLRRSGDVLSALSEHVGDEISSGLCDAIERAKSSISLVVRLRCEEETWILRDKTIQPQGMEPSWTDQGNQALSVT